MPQDIVILEKGGVALDIEDKMPGLTQLYIGMGWDVNPNPAATGDYDLDSTIFLLGANGKVLDSHSVVYYGSLTYPTGLDPKTQKAQCAILHSADNLTGGGEGDDEWILINFAKLDPRVQKMVFIVNMYQGTQRHQKFADVKNAFARLVNASNDQEFARVNLGSEFGPNTGVVIAELFQQAGTWRVKARKEPADGSIKEIAGQIGVV